MQIKKGSALAPFLVLCQNQPHSHATTDEVALVVIKALSKDAGLYDILVAIGLFSVGIAAAAVLHRYARRKLGDLE